jgi:glycosyltransferase involved in cell wall biosynthesis
MSSRSLRIAWIGAGPGRRETGGAPGVAVDLLAGLTGLGHRIDCFLTGAEHPLPERLVGVEGLTFVWGDSGWRWKGWYNRTSIGVFVTGLFARGLASLRLRREVARRHREEPYDLIFQFCNVEALAMPASLRRSVPLVIHPATHIAGELRFLLAERRLSLRCQPAYVFAIAAATMALRVLVQRRRIRTARLLICISGVFRDHLVRDYDYPREHTLVIPNPIRLERFAHLDPTREVGSPASILVLGRIAARKGIEDVVALAHLLRKRNVDACIQIVGGPSLWSDYTPLLADLPPASSEYAGRVSPADIPAELARTDVLLQAAKYEPFGLTVGEALAAGVPVVATSETGAIEGIDRKVAAEVAPGDVEAMAVAIVQMLERLQSAPRELREQARAEAARRFAPETVCEQISLALEQLVERASPS